MLSVLDNLLREIITIINLNLQFIGYCTLSKYWKLTGIGGLCFLLHRQAVLGFSSTVWFCRINFVGERFVVHEYGSVVLLYSKRAKMCTVNLVSLLSSSELLVPRNRILQGCKQIEGSLRQSLEQGCDYTTSSAHKHHLCRPIWLGTQFGSRFFSYRCYCKGMSHIIKTDGQANPICHTRREETTLHICPNCPLRIATGQNCWPYNAFTKCNLQNLEFMERKVHRGIQQVIFSTGATTSNHLI